MSGPGRPTPRLIALAEQLPLQTPLIEFQDWHLASRHGGTAVLPWRAAWLNAQAAQVTAVADASDLTGSWRSALVHIQKGRAATETDRATAWRLLAPGGDLLLLGSNDLGIVSFSKRLGTLLAQTGEVLATGGHGRLVRFKRSDHPGPALPPAVEVPSQDGETAVALSVAPGVFSGDGLDRGTALLIEQLITTTEPRPEPRRVLDLGCGAGHLAIAALRHWPAAHAVLLDADARAVASATANLTRLGLATRAKVHWWCERDKMPTDPVDLVLINPPCHSGSELDIYQGEILLKAAGQTLASGGRMLVVANRKLPYESTIARFGVAAPTIQRDGFKIIEVKRG